MAEQTTASGALNPVKSYDGCAVVELNDDQAEQVVKFWNATIAGQSAEAIRAAGIDVLFDPDYRQGAIIEMDAEGFNPEFKGVRAFILIMADPWQPLPELDRDYLDSAIYAALNKATRARDMLIPPMIDKAATREALGHLVETLQKLSHEAAQTNPAPEGLPAWQPIPSGTAVAGAIRFVPVSQLAALH